MPVEQLVHSINTSLLRYLPKCRARSAGTLNEALHYAMFPGGKRLRPVLTILGARVFGAPDERVLRAACAVEFVHTSSLIIDDLPCMDDADLRRGNPTLHRVYGEDVALLAGIALLNQSYALFAENPDLVREATECIGVTGIIGGQATDLCNAPEDITLEERDRKTSTLMQLALTAGALAAGASRQDVAPLAFAGQRLGEAYQICDDLLDSGQHGSGTGKTAGQDLRHNRPTHSAGPDVEGRYAEMMRLIGEARQSLLEGFGPREGVTALMGFADRLFASQSRGLQRPCLPV